MFRRFLRLHCKNLKTMYVSHHACLVKVELPVAGVAKFEMCMVIRFLHAEGQLTDLEGHFSVFFPLNSTFVVSQRLKMQFSRIHTQRGGASHFEFLATKTEAWWETYIVFKFLQCGRTNFLNILPLVVYFSFA